MRWKITLSYLPVAARVAKFSQVWECVSYGNLDFTQAASFHSVTLCIETYLGGLVLEQSDGNVTEGGVKGDTLSVGTVAARGRTRVRGGVGRGSRAVVVLTAEH